MNPKANILVIDDEEVVRRSLSRALDNDRCHVETAANGRHGLNALARQAFDLVLLDLKMPEMDGVQVLGEIKKRWPETEVIVITGYPALETAKQAIRLGAYDFLAKPVGPDEVMDAANGAVQHKRWALRSAAAT
jgi:DNA-binding NtrC family response regulator